MKKSIVAVSCMFLATSLLADGASIAKHLGIKAGDKLAKQWEKTLSDDGKKKALGADSLSAADINDLKKYLMTHAADSDAPLF
jgi:hypothetical protein